MGHKKHPHKKKKHTGSSASTGNEGKKSKLEICLKCDSAGVLEAITHAVQEAAPDSVPIDIIHSGIGAVSKTDIFLAQTGSHLILGFDVELNPHINDMAHEYGIEIRLHDTIFRLVEDVKAIAETLAPKQPAEERILGAAKVIALFKSSRKGIILGCEVLKGRLAMNDRFRVIAAAGTIYDGMIESLHIEKDSVKSAEKGRQVGLKIRDFKKVSIGDFVESYQPVASATGKRWQPQPGIFRLTTNI